MSARRHSPRLGVRIRSERGFALPMTILLVAILTVLLAAGFTRVTADHEVDTGNVRSVDAFSVAQSGLQTYLHTVTAAPADQDSIRVNVPGGYAWVVARLVRKPADTLANRIYLLRSTGYALVPAFGAAPQAQRTVAQIAQWQTGRIKAVGAFMAANGLKRDNGGTIVINGNDACSPAASSVPGLITTNVAGQPNPPWTVTGNPSGIVEMNGSGAALAGQAKVDWQSTIGGQLVPDYTSFQNWSWNNAIQVIQGDLALPSVAGGSGILIVTGNLTTSNIFYWQGIVLVGGSITFNGSWNEVLGMVESGMNELLTGQAPSRGDLGNATTYVYYSSCMVNAALSSLTGFVPISNAWIDDWASY